MKKFLLITLICILTVWLFADGNPRFYTQKIINQTTADGQLPGVTNTSATTATNYHITAWIVGREGEVLSSDPALDTDGVPGATPAGALRIWRWGNGSSQPYRTTAGIQLSNFDTPWAAGDVLHVVVTYIDTGESAAWEMTIPTGGSAINWIDETSSQIPIPICPPFPAPTHNLTVESNYPGAEIYRDGVTTTYTTPHVFTEAGTYTVQLAGVTQWEPAEHVWDGTSDETIRFMGVKTPNAVNAVYPLPGSTIHIAWNAPATAVYTLQWAPDPDPAAVAPENYIVKWMDVVQTTVEATVTSWDTPAIGEGTYNWEIIPVVTDPAKGGRRTLQPVRATIANNAKGNGPSQQWTFTIQRDEQPNYNVNITTIPEVGAEIYVDGLDSGHTTPFIFSWGEGTNAVITVVKDYYTFEPENYTINNLNADTECQFTATFVPPVITWSSSVNGLPEGATVGPDNITLSWNIDIVMPPDGFFKVYEDANNPPTTLIYTGTDTEFTIPGPLSPGTYYWFVELHNTGKALLGTSGIRSFIVQNVPVELTSFDAAITSEMFVNLTWVTQSETNVMGFNIYRSDDNVADHAIRINNLMIPAAGTSSTAQTYRWVDSEVEPGHTYYYWLQSVDLNGYSVMHNPISATVNTPDTPPVNELSVLNSIYPNPFSIHANSNVNINVTIKTGEVGTVTVYNLLGQVVKSFKVTSNQTNVTWNAKNAASGIYFVKLSTPTTNMTKKLVIVK